MSMDIWLQALMVIAAMALITWVISLATKDVSIVDNLWSLMFLAATVVYYLFASDSGSHATLLLVLVSTWALRLSIFLAIRNWGEEEDRRYREIRANNEPFWIKSLFIVFGLQAVLAWFISVPLLAAMSATTISTLEIIAITMWACGFLIEAVSDHQLHKFKSNPDNAGKVMDRGLWRYSRHPNYFGECLIWWSFFLFAIGHGPWWIIISPILMTLLLLKVSGVSLMEKDISTRRPEYVDYIRRTSAFIPLPPRKQPSDMNIDSQQGASSQ